jgi:TRAP-type C4-dicarboxylate transport system permease small subunit
LKFNKIIRNYVRFDVFDLKLNERNRRVVLVVGVAAMIGGGGYLAVLSGELKYGG